MGDYVATMHYNCVTSCYFATKIFHASIVILVMIFLSNAIIQEEFHMANSQ